MKLLISGASGFLGGHLARLSTRQGHETYGGYYSYSCKVKDMRRFQWDLADAGQIPRTLNEIQPDIIIHNAALADPGACEKNPALAEKVNKLASIALGKWCQEKNKRLVFISTDMVFDGEKGKYSEEDPVNPLNVYARTKAKTEKLLLKLWDNVLVCRSALMYGNGAYAREYRSEWLHRTLTQKFQAEEFKPVPLFTDQYRSMIAVSNAAQAILEAALQSYTGALHIGGPDKVSRYEFGRDLCKIIGYPVELIKPVKSDTMQPKATRPKDVTLDISRAQQILETHLLGVEAGIRKEYAL